MDYPHRLTMSGLWEIPIGRGRKFGAKLWRPANFLVGGWQLGAIAIRQAGVPLGFGDAIFTGDIGNIALAKVQRSVNHWFNVNAGFNRNSSQQYSNHLRTFPLRFSGVRGPGQSSWDLSLIKEFAVRERLKIQFRAEAYNALNHTNLSNPKHECDQFDFRRHHGDRW